MGIDPQNPKEEHLRTIYLDAALIIRISGEMPTSSTSPSSLVARILELLELQPGLRVLEIGAGTGYNAALMQEIVGEDGHVTTIDIQEDLVAQTIRLLRAAGYEKLK
ncbi:MAG: methyltransferase domain-containing protein [Candidatus Bipolaricaulaceae bacterium]